MFKSILVAAALKAIGNDRRIFCYLDRSRGDLGIRVSDGLKGMFAGAVELWERWQAGEPVSLQDIVDRIRKTFGVKPYAVESEIVYPPSDGLEVGVTRLLGRRTHYRGTTDREFYDIVVGFLLYAISDDPCMDSPEQAA